MVRPSKLASRKGRHWASASLEAQIRSERPFLRNFAGPRRSMACVKSVLITSAPRRARARLESPVPAATSKNRLPGPAPLARAMRHHHQKSTPPESMWFKTSYFPAMAENICCTCLPSGIQPPGSLHLTRPNVPRGCHESRKQNRSTTETRSPRRTIIREGFARASRRGRLATRPRGFRPRLDAGPLAALGRAAPREAL